MKRRLLIIEAASRRWHLETLRVESLACDSREDYGVLSGESLCQYILRRDPKALVIARGPLVFLAGNKASLGYVSPLTSLPHYSFVGGRAAAQLLNLGLDAIVFQSPISNSKPQIPYILISGRAPDLKVQFKNADGLPRGQRSAYYWLLEHELSGEPGIGSILTVGDAAYWDSRSANLAADAIYHAGRGGCGAVFIRFASALALRGALLEPHQFFPPEAGDFARRPNAGIEPLLQRYCARFIRPDGGTIPKLAATGLGERPSLPSLNARQMGYAAADLGSPRLLKAIRQGRTGCHWCPVDCRFYHWVEADYAPGGRDRFLDDFEPTYATFAMLGLRPADDTPEAKVALRTEVDRRLILPIEQLGLDVVDVGLALAALFEGVEIGVIPPADLPPELCNARLGDLNAAVRAVELLRAADAASAGVLQSIVAHGPQALAEAYPALRDRVFSSGPRTLGNAGHCNALWTFLMPFSRFFGHYVGQIYKIDEPLPPPGAPEGEIRACFQRVVRRMLDREYMGVLCNALSMCAFVFVVFTQDGQRERLDDADTLVQTLARYGIRTTRADLMWFAQNFWAQSIALKAEYGWRPPAAADFPRRVYEALSLALERPVEELQTLMGWLIEEWRCQAGDVLARFGYAASW
jgi:aldehyde:ferredoxin oxidoreductase